MLTNFIGRFKNTYPYDVEGVGYRSSGGASYFRVLIQLLFVCVLVQISQYYICMQLWHCTFPAASMHRVMIVVGTLR